LPLHGRVAEQILDAAGRISEVRAPGVLTVFYTYDELGRTKSVTQGTRTTSFVWNDRDELVSLTDAMQRTVTFDYDAAGRELRNLSILEPQRRLTCAIELFRRTQRLIARQAFIDEVRRDAAVTQIKVN
jgi:YD repeat-containing protein